MSKFCLLYPDVCFTCSLFLEAIISSITTCLSLSISASLCLPIPPSLSPICHYSLSNNLPFLTPPSAHHRLLKVKPEERLTIEGVLAHPWLNCTEALDNVLPSAQMMMDKVSGEMQVIMWSQMNRPAEATVESWLGTWLTCLWLFIQRNNFLTSFSYCLSSYLPGGSGRYPAGPCRAAGQHENSGSECQPEAPQLCQQPNPQEEETPGVWLLLCQLL